MKMIMQANHFLSTTTRKQDWWITQSDRLVFWRMKWVFRLRMSSIKGLISANRREIQASICRDEPSWMETTQIKNPTIECKFSNPTSNPLFLLSSSGVLELPNSVLTGSVSELVISITWKRSHSGMKIQSSHSHSMRDILRHTTTAAISLHPMDGLLLTVNFQKELPSDFQRMISSHADSILSKISLSFIKITTSNCLSILTSNRSAGINYTP